MPALSVLLPVHDARTYLAASLSSLRRQSFTDFEIIAVDDGSTDGSAEWLDREARRDPRLRIVHTEHRGLPTALNTALQHARGRLIARHDADDLSHRRRFELQVEHLRRHRGDAVVGSRLRMFPTAAVGIGMKRWADWHNALLTHDAMAGEILIDSPLAHGTAMLRTSWLERVGGWAERGWAEDLDLWLRMLQRGARFAKLRPVLYAWRQHRASATRRDPRYRRERFIALKLDALERGLLRHASHMTLVGVGQSLARARKVFVSTRQVNTIEARRPDAHVIGRVQPPVVLVYGALRARSAGAKH